MQLQPNAPALNRRLTGQRVVLLSVCVVRPRLIVITPQPHDGRRVLLISTDHIPLAD